MDVSAIHTLLRILEHKNIETFFVHNKLDALATSKTILTDCPQTIGLGGSVSVEEIGLQDYILNHQNFTVFNQYEYGITFEENLLRRKNGLLADTYICGINAITTQGQLVNADGAGNRVAGMIFGPKKVILIAGINKIVTSISAALDRIYHVAAVKNVERINKKAAYLFKKRDYTIPTTANYFTIIEQSHEPGRIKLVLVNQNLGF